MTSAGYYLADSRTHGKPGGRYCRVVLEKQNSVVQDFIRSEHGATPAGFAL